MPCAYLAGLHVLLVIIIIIRLDDDLRTLRRGARRRLFPRGHRHGGLRRNELRGLRGLIL